RSGFTPRDMRDLLRLFEPEASEKKIQANNDQELFEMLFSALKGEGLPKPKFLRPRPFSVVFDPATRRTLIGRPCNVSVCDPDDCGLKITITEEPQPELAKL